RPPVGALPSAAEPLGGGSGRGNPADGEGARADCMTIDEVRALFAYDQWANGMLIGTIEQLSDEQFTRDLGNSFPSIRDTLAHIVAGDWIWLRRWRGESPRALPKWKTLQEIKSQLGDVEAGRAAFVDPF